MIGCIAAHDVCAEVTAALPPGSVVSLDIDAAAEAIRSGEVDLLVIALDGEPRDLVEKLSGVRGAALRRMLPVVALVARDDPALLAAALDAGVSDVAGLPLIAAECRARVDALLRRAGVARRSRAKARAQRLQAMVDPVTRLYNRRYFDGEVARGIDASRRSGAPLTLLMVDIDGLKPINDIFGHAAGDRVLASVAARLIASLRGPDIVARIGGDEIAVAMPGTDLATATRVARRLCEAVGEGIDDDVPVTVSIGVAELTDADRDAAAVLARADAALYAGKRAGRNRVEVAT